MHDYTAMDRILREEKKYIAGICKKIRACGANVLLIQKSILRDAVTDLSLHYLAKMKIMVVTVRATSPPPRASRESQPQHNARALRCCWRAQDIERDEVEFISKTLGCTPVAHPEGLSADKLGSAELVEDISVAGARSGAHHHATYATSTRG